MAKAGAIQVQVSVITEKRLADALARLGASEIEAMAWSPFEKPEQYVGDPEESVLAEDPYPMASLARAILRELGR